MRGEAVRGHLGLGYSNFKVAVNVKCMYIHRGVHMVRILPGSHSAFGLKSPVPG